MMPDADGGRRMLGIDGNVVRSVVRIDELIPEDRHFEKRRYEQTMLPEV